MINAQESEIRGVQQRRLSEGVYSEFPAPDMFDGFSIPDSLYSAATEITETALDPVLAGSEEKGGIAGFAAGLTRKILIDEVARSRPDPNTTGWAASILNSLTTVVGEVAAGSAVAGPVGAMAGVGGVKGYTDYRLAQREGVDENTARKMGVISGATMAAAVAAPVALGATLPVKVATGAGMNVGFGGAQRGATSKVLRDAGYEDMADQYKIFDPLAMAADVVLGGAFGGVASIRTRDAGLTLNDALQFEESGPGIPADGQTRSAHTKAMAAAAEQVLRGEEVNISEHFLQETNFVPHPEDVEVSRAYDDAFKELGLADLLDEARVLEEQAASLRPQEEAAKNEKSDIQFEESLGFGPEPRTRRFEAVLNKETKYKSEHTEGVTTSPKAKIVAYEKADGSIDISDIVVEENSRRQGEATALVNALFERFPDRIIKAKGVTGDGLEFFTKAFDRQTDGTLRQRSSVKSKDSTSKIAEDIRLPTERSKEISSNLVHRPLTLRGFVRKNGGVDDSDGWLKKQELHKDSRFKGVIKKDGIPLDKMARLAQEEGYFDAENPDRPSDLTADDLVQALMDEQGGNDRYSLKDASKAQKYLDKLAEKEGKDQEQGAVENVKIQAKALGFELNDAESREVAILEANGYDLQDAAETVLERSAIQDEVLISEKYEQEPEFENDLPFETFTPESAGKEASEIAQESQPGRSENNGQAPKEPQELQDLTSQILAEKPDMEIPLLDVPEESLATIAARNADKRIKGKVAQKTSDFGLFDAENEKALASQGDIFKANENVVVANTIKASDALKAADDEIKAAKDSGKIFDAAVDCFLRKGQ